MDQAEGTFDITPEQTYQLVLAALDLVASVSGATLKNCRRRGASAPRPGVSPTDLVALVDVLNSLRPETPMADRVIAAVDARLKASKPGS